MKAPFPYFGSKQAIAPVVWQALGDDCLHYVEPFAGSLATLLHQPYNPGRVETVNDWNCWITNFWRAMRDDPLNLAKLAEGPVITLDLHAWARHFKSHHNVMREALRQSPRFYDLEAAARWVQCQSWAIGRNLNAANNGKPDMSSRGRGIAAITRRDILPEIFAELSRRLRHVRIHSGDWLDVVTPSIIESNAWPNCPVGLFFDPPYDDEDIDRTMYGEDVPDLSVARQVEKWCVANGDNPRFRIVLAGYDDNYSLPGWHKHMWTAPLGYGTNDNNKRDVEVLWCSPHCPIATPQNQTKLF